MAGQKATFSVSASGAGLSYKWQKNGEDIDGAEQASYTTPVTVASDSGSHFQVIVSSSKSRVSSQAALLTVLTRIPADTATFHGDAERTGQNLNETVLTPANVNPAGFGKIGFYSTDGLVDAQPLYLENVPVQGKGAHNVLYVVTEHDSAYAFDADTGTVLWKVSALGKGETSSDPRDCGAILVEIGIAQTPVIDRNRGPNGVMYLVAMSKDGSGNYYHRLHALDLVTGAELFGGPTLIAGSYTGSGAGNQGGNVVFDAKQYKERSASLLTNGTLYLAWGSHCDAEPYTSWLMAYDPYSLQQKSVLNLTPNGYGGGIWSVGALAGDSAGNVYTVNGNGIFDTNLNSMGFPSSGNLANAYLKFSSSNGLQVADYFAPSNTVALSGIDFDLGSGSPLLLPDLKDSSNKVRHLMIGAGKDGTMYIVDRDAMGKFNPQTNNVYQEIDAAFPSGTWSGPAYFNNTVYYCAVADNIKAYAIEDARLSPNPVDEGQGPGYAYPGSVPTISAHGTTNGLVWTSESASVGVLHAYNAASLSNELYNSFYQPSRDGFGIGSKFIPPTVANGKVYVAATKGVAVFGLLH